MMSPKEVHVNEHKYIYIYIYIFFFLQGKNSIVLLVVFEILSALFFFPTILIFDYYPLLMADKEIIFVMYQS